MFRRFLSSKPFLSFAKRSLYVDVKPHSKLFIKSASPLEITCLPACEADKCSTIIPDSGSFKVIDGCRIEQEASHNVSDQPDVIRVPAMRGRFTKFYFYFY